MTEHEEKQVDSRVMKKRSILIVAAHPDDEVLGCGGTMAKLSQDDNDVYTMILGEGVTARDNRRDRDKRRNEIGELKKQAEEANKILGVKKVFFDDFPDNRFDTVPLLDIIKSVEGVKNEVRPDIVFTHYHGDLNIDHQITFRAVLTAFRPVERESVSDIYSFEVPSSTEWNFQNSNVTFSANYFYSLSADHIQSKIRALKTYKREIKEYPHPRSPEAIEALARFRGATCCNEYAEAFRALRIVR